MSRHGVQVCIILVTIRVVGWREETVQAGLKLKNVRERLGLRYREVEKATNLIAQRHMSPDFAVGLSRLADIENKGVIPSIHRLYSLCAVYRLNFPDVLKWYGIDLGDAVLDFNLLRPSETHLVQFSPGDGSVTLPLKLDPGLDFRRTTDLSRMIQQWGKVPISLLDNLDMEEHRYAIIGADDYFMFPLLRPGALIQIDESQRKIQNTGWTHEFERPIYFFELRDGYACCWANRSGNHLILQPHPSSPCEPVVVEYDTAIDVIGRVAGIAMQLESVYDPRVKTKKKPRSVVVTR